METLFRPTEKQLLAIRLLDDPKVWELLYGGAKGGGKTTLGCLWCFAIANRMIEAYHLKPSKYPLLIGFMGRRRGTDFVRYTLEKWKTIIPSEAYRLKERNQELIIRNTVKYYYGGLDNEELIKKFNSAEMAIAFVDQAEEIESEKLVNELRMSLRLTIDNKPVPHKILWTANPRAGWLKDTFIDQKLPNKVFLRSLWSDNPYLPDQYVTQMEDALRNTPELLRAYRDGSWDIVAGADQIIQEEWVNQAKETKLHLPDRCVIGADIARFGDDQTVIYGLNNSKIVMENIYGKQDLYYTADQIEEMAFKMKTMGLCPSAIGVDTTGMPGVTDILRRKQQVWNFPCKIIEINPQEGHERGVPVHLYNRRAQLWENASKMFSKREIEQDFTNYPELKRQLCIPQYKFIGSKMIIESKDDIKKRLRRSPDQADAYIIGLYILQYAETVTRDEWGEEDRYESALSWMRD